MIPAKETKEQRRKNCLGDFINNLSLLFSGCFSFITHGVRIGCKKPSHEKMMGIRSTTTRVLSLHFYDP